MRRGEVYDARLDPTEGSEQAGIRPVVIVSRDAINAASPVFLVVPCTTYRAGRRLPQPGPPARSRWRSRRGFRRPGRASPGAGDQSPRPTAGPAFLHGFDPTRSRAAHRPRSPWSPIKPARQDPCTIPGARAVQGFLAGFKARRSVECFSLLMRRRGWMSLPLGFFIGCNRLRKQRDFSRSGVSQ